MHETNQEHILFLTGKLAQKRLQRILEDMAPTEFTYEIQEYWRQRCGFDDGTNACQATGRFKRGESNYCTGSMPW